IALHRLTRKVIGIALFLADLDKRQPPASVMGLISIGARWSTRSIHPCLHWVRLRKAAPGFLLPCRRAAKNPESRRATFASEQVGRDPPFCFDCDNPPPNL